MEQTSRHGNQAIDRRQHGRCRDPNDWSMAPAYRSTRSWLGALSSSTPWRSGEVSGWPSFQWYRRCCPSAAVIAPRALAWILIKRPATASHPIGRDNRRRRRWDPRPSKWEQPARDTDLARRKTDLASNAAGTIHLSMGPPGPLQTVRHRPNSRRPEKSSPSPSHPQPSQQLERSERVPRPTPV